MREVREVTEETGANQDDDEKLYQTQDVAHQLSPLRQEAANSYYNLRTGNTEEADFKKSQTFMSNSLYKKEKDQGIKAELENDDEWAEVDKYRQLLYDRELQLQKEKKSQ